MLVFKVMGKFNDVCCLVCDESFFAAATKSILTGHRDQEFWQYMKDHQDESQHFDCMMLTTSLAHVGA